MLNKVGFDVGYLQILHIDPGQVGAFQMRYPGPQRLLNQGIVIGQVGAQLRQVVAAILKRSDC